MLTDQQKITAFDIFKDAKLFSGTKILDSNKLLKYIENITSQKSTKLTDIRDRYDFIKEQFFNTDLQTKEFIKTPIQSLGKISEDGKISGELKSVPDCKNIIKKEKPKFLTSKMHFFYDAGSSPLDFCVEPTNCEYYETIASYIDPATRPQGTFIDTTNVAILDNILHQCGIGKENTQIDYKIEDGKIKITITFNPFDDNIDTIILEGFIDRNGNLNNVNVTVNKINGETNFNGDTKPALQNLFQGNNTKNNYINSLGNTPNENDRIIATLYYLCKELGDTYQAIILKMILEKPGEPTFNSGEITLKKENCCLSTNDSVLFLRSKSDEINIPVLLYNDGCIRYYSSLSKKEIIKKILTDEIENAKNENNQTIQFLKKIKAVPLNDFLGASIEPQIKLNLESNTKLYKSNYELTCEEFLEIIIDNINSVNLFLDGLKDYIEREARIPVQEAVTALKKKQEVLELQTATQASREQHFQRIKREHINSINTTYRIICDQLLILLAEGNNNTTHMQSIKRNINAFKSSLTVTINGTCKINLQTKSIFPAVSLLEPGNKLREIMKDCCFSDRTLITFKEWLNKYKKIEAPLSRRGAPRQRQEGGNKRKRPDNTKVDHPDVEYDFIDSETNNFIFLYENLFPYINCFPQLLYCFNDMEFLQKFINYNLLNYSTSNILDYSLSENYDQELNSFIIKNMDEVMDEVIDEVMKGKKVALPSHSLIMAPMEKIPRDPDDINEPIIDKFLDNLKIVALFGVKTEIKEIKEIDIKFSKSNKENKTLFNKLKGIFKKSKANTRKNSHYPILGKEQLEPPQSSRKLASLKKTRRTKPYPLTTKVVYVDPAAAAQKGKKRKKTKRKREIPEIKTLKKKLNNKIKILYEKFKKEAKILKLKSRDKTSKNNNNKKSKDTLKKKKKKKKEKK